MTLDVLKICLIHLNDLIHGRYDDMGKPHFIISTQCEICELEK